MKCIGKVNPTVGNIISSMIWYSLPIFIGSLMQTLFTACDLIVVRMMADSTAVASVGATSTVTNLFVTSTVGIAAGVNIVLARLVGAKEHERVRKMVPTALISAFVLGLVVAVLGAVFGADVMRLMDCPDDCFDGARTYFIVYVLSAPFILIYNFAATIIRVDGDSLRPTYYMIIAGVVNVILNFLLCFVLDNKVLAVALATVASQVVGAFLTVVRLCLIKGECRLSFRHLTFDFTLCKKIFLYGLPSAVSNATFGISNVQVQGAINTYGSSAIAGNTATVNLESFVSSAQNAIISATSVFIGQNIGAKKPERVKKSFLWGLVLAVGISLVASNLMYLFRKPLLAIYLGADSEAFTAASVRMIFVLQFYFVYALRGIFSSGLNAFGYTRFTMINSLVCIVGFRLCWMAWAYPLNPCLEMVYATYLLSAILGTLMAMPMYLWVYRRYRRGIVTNI